MSGIDLTRRRYTNYINEKKYYISRPDYNYINIDFWRNSRADNRQASVCRVV